jgi:hypothetical protein
MTYRAGILLTLAAWSIFMQPAAAQTYTGMAIPGTHNGWNTAPSMASAGANQWVGTQTLSSASGQFKFAANNGWTYNWGGNASFSRVTAISRAPDLGGGDLNYSGIVPGPYRFTFNSSTLEFKVEAVNAIPVPTVTNLALVGSFNGWTEFPNSQLTNHPGTTLWSGSIDLQNDASFQFQINGSPTNRWGAPAPATYSVPVAQGSAAGSADVALANVFPGTFRFTLDVSNALFSVVQTATQDVPIARMAVQGSFIGTNTPPANMMLREGTTLWESDHHLTNTTAQTIRFSAANGVYKWGATNGIPALSLPASGVMAADSTNFATVNVNAPGRYRITFDHATGQFTFRRRYVDTSSGNSINLLKNPGFEFISNGNQANDWFSYQAETKAPADGVAPHTGNSAGAILAKLFDNWTDYASYSQTVAADAGKLYSASAWFKATPDWTAATMQLKVEWRNGAGQPIGGDLVANVSPISTDWQKFSVEGEAPVGTARAHIVLLCSGAGTTGAMHVDDAEFRIAATRRQDFETWGSLTSYGPASPDWSISSGKAVYNIAPGRPAAGVFISQYVEGTGNNKAVEIFNGKLDAVDLAAGNYVLQQYDNGATSPTTEIPLSGILQPGGTLVVARPSSPAQYAPDPAISALPNLLTNKLLTFNGDDVLVLRSNGVVLDRIGKVGANAVGSVWSRATTDRTLIRKSNVYTGNLDSVHADFSNDGWDVADKDAFDGLGSHDVAFYNPDEPYTPAGLSLLMNTNAFLISDELAGGIGDVSFWFRTETTSTPVTVSIATGPAEDGPWTTNSILAGVNSVYYSSYATYVNRADHSYLKIQQTEGAPNRFRIDQILVSAPAGDKRLEDFSSWTDPGYELTGNYTRFGWSILNAFISPSGGLYNSQATWLEAPNGSVSTPTYQSGLGEFAFWAKPAEDQPAHLLLQTTTNGGSSWTTQASFQINGEANHSKWLYITNPSQARLVFDPDFDSSSVLLDNVEARLPQIYYNQNFDSWPTRSSYTSETFQGWTIQNTLVDSMNAYQGQVARLNTTIGNYVLSPEFPEGFASISFRIRKWNASDTPYTLQVQTSADGSAWTTLASVSATSAEEYQAFSYFLTDSTSRFVRFYHSAGGARVLIDDIRIGAEANRPQVIVTPGISPEAPSTNDAVQIQASVIPRYGASILSVTGVYRISSGAFNFVEMLPTGFGTYAAAATVPPLPANTDVRYFVRVQYAGIGANPAFQGYSTNLVVSQTNLYNVSAIKKGNVWINEISYLNIDEWAWEEDFEFIELCGVAGSDIGNWTIQLAFGSDRDIAANGNNPVYASYTIPGSTVFANQHNGFGFYVLGDAELQPLGHPVNQTLTTTVPTTVAPTADWDRDHMHNSRGVIRLLNQYSNVVYSLSYAGFATGSEAIPVQQALYTENSVGLVGTGSQYAAFSSWSRSNLTIGAVNEGQTLVEPGGVELAVVWHRPTHEVVPLSLGIFHMRNPIDAQSKTPLQIHYGYPNNLYNLPVGDLHYRRVGLGWSVAPMSLLAGSLDGDGNAYVRGSIPMRTFPRASTIEYVVEARTGGGTATTYVGYDPDAGYALFDTLDAAKQTPFTYTYQMHPEIYVHDVSTNSASWFLYTEGNDVLEPYVNFKVYTTTNIFAPLNQWTPTNFTVTPVDAFGANVFTIPRATNRPARFYRVAPQWP